MTLNKKGTTLVELIVSITLISIVIIFMFRLLVDINNEQTNNVFAVDNQVNRAEILRIVNNDLTKKTLKDVKSTSTNVNTLIIQFTYTDGKSSIITAGKDYFQFKSFDGKTRKWNLENCTLYTNKANVYLKQDGNVYIMNIDIEIHTINDYNTEGNNNPLDDIMLPYIGKVTEYKPNIACLGKGC